jgi:peptidoglycan/LPS O-acetylase OafA/YrhL
MASEIIAMSAPTFDILPKMKRYAGLDALRGIAALLLVIFHVQGIPQLEISGEFRRIVGFFGAGVPLFYSLSAFSLMSGYHDKLQSPGGLLHFYIRRIFRILPLFYTLLIFWLLVRKFYFKAETSFSIFSINYLPVFGLIPGQHEGLVWASWSIGVEILFYMVFPLALIVSRTLASSFFVFLATVAISASSQEALAPLKDIAPSFSYMAISTQIVFFGAGLFAYRLGEFLRKKISGYTRTKQRVCAEAIFLSGIAFVLLYWLTPIASWAGGFHLGTQMLAFSWILMLSPVLIHGQLNTLAIRPLERAGKISFSLYLLNPPVIYFLSKTGLFTAIYTHFSISNIAFGICLLVSLSVLWILSQITFCLIEKKGILLGNILLEKSELMKNNKNPKLKAHFFLANLKLLVFLTVLPWLTWWSLRLLAKEKLHAEPVVTQSIKPETDKPLTKKLWESLSPQDAVTPNENLKLLENGIRIHPGGNPKSATFLVAGKFKNVQLVCFIDKLPASALLDPKAARAAVEIFIDGKSQSRRLVNSQTNQAYQLDLTNIKEIKVVVDCANGSANWDWVNIGLEKQ